MTKRVLTIQDISCVGQCSITVALPVISTAGIETCILPTALLSTHTGGAFKDFTFFDLSAEISKITEAWEKYKQKFDCVYCGYLGGVNQISAVKDVIKKCLKEDGIFILDPVMGDIGELYNGFDNAYVKNLAKLCKNAYLITPNLTEACFLTETEYRKDYDKQYIEGLMHKLFLLGAKNVIITGITLDNQLGIAVKSSCENKISYILNTKYNKIFYGTGDLFTSAVVGAIMNEKTLKKAALIASEFLEKVIINTLNEWEDEHWYGMKFEKCLPFYYSLINSK